MIRWLRSDRYAASNLRCPTQIGRLGSILRVRAAALAGDDAPAAEAHWRWPNLVLRGSNRPGLGSRMIYTVRVIYWRPWLGSRRPATASTAVAAGRHGGTRRRVRARAALGTGTATNGCVCVRKAKVTRNGVGAMLYRAAGTKPRRSGGGEAPAAAFRPPGLSTGHYI